ncbi:unnamed protein product [Mycena citricolor]|uniref:Uncharacterized protein n=1 Tax=Mycena citricolor TaxID=2018698 RepID=A0AAD2K1P0_9AGAR|nr:unnamed protein product [Mycena citricolor]
MADVTYNTASFPSLVQTVKALVNKSPNKTPQIILGYKERDPGERELWGMMEAGGLHFQSVGRIVGSGENAVEIWQMA